MKGNSVSKSASSSIFALLAIIASKGKVLLGAILKVKGLGTFISMAISMVGYWWAWDLGFWGALGFVALIWVHEMGHVLAARKIGLPVTAPVFVPFLGALPLDIQIRREADGGTPTVAADPDGRVAQVYKEIARKVAIAVAERQKDMSHKFPSIVVQNT